MTYKDIVYLAKVIQDLYLDMLDNVPIVTIQRT